MASLQTSDATYLAQGWADPALTSWEAVPSEDWNPSGAATADVTQVTVHRTLAPNPATNIGHEDHLHPHVSASVHCNLFRGSHKGRHLKMGLTSTALPLPLETRSKAFL